GRLDALARMAVPGGKPVEALEARARRLRLEAAPHRLRRLETLMDRDPRRMGEPRVISRPEPRRTSPRAPARHGALPSVRDMLARYARGPVLARLVPFRGSPRCCQGPCGDPRKRPGTARPVLGSPEKPREVSMTPPLTPFDITGLRPDKGA